MATSDKIMNATTFNEVEDIYRFSPKPYILIRDISTTSAMIIVTNTANALRLVCVKKDKNIDIQSKIIILDVELDAGSYLLPSPTNQAKR